MKGVMGKELIPLRFFVIMILEKYFSIKLNSGILNRVATCQRRKWGA